MKTSVLESLFNNVQGVFWTSYVRSIYVQCVRVKESGTKTDATASNTYQM